MHAITVLVWSALFFHFSHNPVPVSRVLPTCYDEFSVALDEHCQRAVTLSMVAPAESFSPGAKVIVEDGYANGDTIDLAGRFHYSVVDAQGKLLCGGYVLAKDDLAPRLLLANSSSQVLDCQDISFVFNNPATIGSPGSSQSPKIVAGQAQTIPNTHQILWEEDQVKNLGLPFFQDGCHNSKCPVSLKWADQLVYYGCDSIQKTGTYARIFRHWKAFDCAGNASESIQEIVFRRNTLSAYQFSYGAPATGTHTLQFETCDKQKFAIPAEQVYPFVYSFFHHAGFQRRLYLQAKDSGYGLHQFEYPFAATGTGSLQIQRQLLVSDPCRPNLLDTIRLNLKIGDFTAPTINHSKDTVVVSVQPFACEASILSSIQGLKDHLGVYASDNCKLDSILINLEILSSSIAGWKKVEPRSAGGVISGLAQGLYRLILQARDVAGNHSRDTLYVRVVDKIAPVAICDDSLRIAISSAFTLTNGISKLRAEDVDEGSYDNCGLRWLRVRRNITTACTERLIQQGFDYNRDSLITTADGWDVNQDGDIDDFGERFTLINQQLYTPLLPTVNFYCCDAGAQLEVELWAEDLAGNRAYCHAKVSDGRAPLKNPSIDPELICTVPPDTTLYCLDTALLKINNPQYANRVFGSLKLLLDTFCPPRVIYSLNNQVVNGEGFITRKWQIKIPSPLGDSILVVCQQKIEVYSQALFEAIFPADQVLYCEDLPGDTLIFTNLGCVPWKIEVSETRTQLTNKDECYQISRTYTLTNPLAFDTLCADTLAGEATYVINRSTLGNYGRDPVYFFAEAVEDADTLNYYLSLNGDENHADDVLINGLLPACTVEGLAQSYNLFQRFSYTQILRVIDDQRPELFALDSLPQFKVDPQTCTAEVEVYFKAVDACSEVREVIERRTFVDLYQTGEPAQYFNPDHFDAKWFWDKNSADTSFYINIRGLPPGIHNLITVVRDACGNLSIPTTLAFEVVDKQRVCAGDADDGYIEGAISTIGETPLPDVKLQLFRGNTLWLETSTDVDGHFRFDRLDPAQEYRLVPAYNLNYSNGISTYDLILIQKHILGLGLIQNPYRLIAADVNNSRTISTLDMIQLRKLILQLEKKFSQNSSWRFVDAGFAFPNPLNPWQTPFPEQVLLVPEQKKRVNFIAIKVGDPSGNGGN